MKINKNSRIFLVALLTTFVSLLWLNIWHEINYQYGVFNLSPFRNLFSDAALVFLPILAAVWVSASVVQWIIGGFEGRLSSKLQIALSVIIPSLLISAVLLVVENSRSFHTGIGKDLALAVSICGSIHADGFSFPWNFLLGGLPTYQGYRVFVLLQDSLNLFLANVSVFLLFVLTIEKVEAKVEAGISKLLKPNSKLFAFKTQLNRLFIFVVIFSLAFGGFLQAKAAPFNATDATVVPHYFGPWPNWATSPLTNPDVQVVITGNGNGATAEATVGANGAITGITVTDGGSGYSNAKVDIIGAGTGATAKATIVKQGAVIDVTMTNFGAGYTAPSVSFTGGGSGSGAAAIAFGGVDQVSVINGGSGYTMPTVDFDLPDGPGGVQAQGHAEWDTVTGSITAVVVDSPGSGYSKAPGVAFHNGTLFDPIPLNAGGSPASASSSLFLTSVVLYSPGSNYKNPPAVVFNDPTGLGASAYASIDNGVISAIDLTKPGEGYVTSGGIRKFVDGLPMLTSSGANNLGQYMPIAVPDTTTFSGADYYVIALVQYREQLHSDLPPTLLREYVQLMPLPAGQDCAAAGGVPLFTDLLDGSTTETLMPDGSQACGMDNPHYLGPIMVAQKDRAARITFYNLLPTGAGGDLFMPVDTTFMGAGMNPDGIMMGNEPYDPVPVANGDVTDPYRNPYCGEQNPLIDGGIGKDGTECFVDNRATLHLHGGITPWISDGTPHQWITPANENTPWPEGVSVGNVPDMIGQAAIDAGVPDCSAPDDGCSTFYYTNQQSARLMFYHDHVWGLTRLNVYAGEAAGYIIRDDAEQSLIDAGIIPGAIAGEEIPLVIQDKTFVPDDTQLYDQYDANGNLISYGQDPTWDKSRWGGKGNLWYEHVYMPAQNPSDPTGMSAYGRWMYGPWFWPPQTDVKYGPIDNPYFDPSCNLDDPATWQYQVDPFCEPPLIPGTPNNSAGMEQFNDTPIVNGTAYPTVTLEPKSYRFRILNAANDRFFNLQWYVADPTTASTGLNAYGEVIGGTEVAFNANELAAAQLDPNIFPTPDTSISPAGPSWIQIGTEGGFLPAPVVVDNQPITWITDPTRFDVGNVDMHSLLVAPAERADVVVDFSKYAGQTLILYNDAPAAFPARVASYDYYTGAPDLSPNGAPTILPGYGPNTRTIMQVKISATGLAPAYDLAKLQSEFRHQADGSGVFESSQHPIIVGQAAYNSAYGTSFANGAWCNSPSNPSAKCDGLARISEQGGDLFKFDTLLGNQVSIPLEPKAIHDEMNSATFDEFGRMTANLGVESVPANPGGQNINLMPYVFPPTEVINTQDLPKNDPVLDASGSIIYGDKGEIIMTPITGIAVADGTQIWKITHNGVDTHPIHFHLYDVQLLNRVTWDNIIIPPDPNELGWKDTIRISPLEDTIVALRPIIPWLPFEIPNSVRELSPMMPTWNGIGPDIATGTSGVGTIDSATIADAFLLGIPPSSPQGEPIDIFNHYINFGWEYVFHCHILSHEEMDMMRPVLVALPPKAPINVTFDPSSMTLYWQDNSISETGYVIEKLVGGVWTEVAYVDRPLTDQPDGLGIKLENTAGDVLSIQDPLYVPGDQYRVLAQNTVGDTWDYALPGGNELTPGTYAFPVTTAKSEWAYLAEVNGAPTAPTNLVVTGFTATQVDLAWVDNSSNEDGFVIERSDDLGVTWAPLNSTATDVTTFSDTAVTPNTTFHYRVFAFNTSGNSTPTNTVVVTTLEVAPEVPTDLITTSVTSSQVDLAWTSISTNVIFVVERSNDAGVTWTQVGQTAVDVTSFIDNTVVPGTTYDYRVYAFSANGNSSPSIPLQNVIVPDVVPADPTGLVATLVTSTQVDLAWTDNSNNEVNFLIQRSSDLGATWNDVGSVSADVTTFSDTTVMAGTQYSYLVYANGVVGLSNNPAGPIDVTTTTGTAPAAPSNLLVTARTQSSITVTWVDNSNGTADGFTLKIATDKNFTQSLQTFNVGPGVTTYQFYPLAPNTKYFIQVAAFNAAGPSQAIAIADKTLK